MKKRITLGVFGAVLFYSLMVGVTKISSAQPGDFPVTPPTAPFAEGKSTGGVQAEDGDMKLKLSFNAHSGANVKGNVVYSDSEGNNFKGKVNVCYSQSGNQAVFVGTVDKGNVSEGYFKVDVLDNGEGKKATNPDMIMVTMSDTAPDCTMDEPTAEVMKGNLQVH